MGYKSSVSKLLSLDTISEVIVTFAYITVIVCFLQMYYLFSL